MSSDCIAIDPPKAMEAYGVTLHRQDESWIMGA